MKRERRAPMRPVVRWFVYAASVAALWGGVSMLTSEPDAAPASTQTASQPAPAPTVVLSGPITADYSTAPPMRDERAAESDRRARDLHEVLGHLENGAVYVQGIDGASAKPPTKLDLAPKPPSRK